ncbi:protein transport protein SEC31 [Pseudoxanthomonas sp. GM95]|uniref:hypothetical protein n=1 Tax=Pseudoxanthomonas sp. GM95 TaxID=1881043 RepID=UPI0008B2949D|nr:hypothetical protein [Pseudoxanthomonas sp. GM95]SEM37061.1 protein transport protein SEC31 [Pseudoxanthomonas sp. GM95]
MRFIRSHRLAAATLAALLSAGSAFAVDQSAVADTQAEADMPPPPPGPPGPPPPHDPKFKAALDACAAELGLPPPPKPGEDRKPPADGKRPDFSRMEACMTAKGFKRPPHPHGPPGPPGPPPEGEADGGGGGAN